MDIKTDANAVMSFFSKACVSLIVCALGLPLSADPVPHELRTGVAEHAFDHMGNLSDMAGTAAACGSTVIYCSGIGPGYMALPAPVELAQKSKASLAYLKKARADGVKLAIGYVCATSIVNLNSFDTNWTPQFRAQFRTPPAQWLQQDKNGRPLPSWYGAPYEPACMNNPDWRAYEKFVVREQLKAGCDGIFFDNPTVHKDGCYCPFCMEKFDAFLAAKPGAARPQEHSTEALRQWAGAHPAEFMDFRSTIASDFINDMRTYARTIKPRALVTCNNSLNTPDTLFSQCRAMGYNIDGLSRVQDFLLIEDMCSQARRTADGRVIEYGPTYKILHAISHDKPIVACTIADSNYHTSPNLARLSMAEAAANDASWLLWPFWPDEKMRKDMAAVIRPEADFLRHNQMLLNETEPRCDVLVYLNFRRWLATDHCAVADVAAALGRANIQFAVCSQDNLAADIADGSPLSPVLLIESFSALNAAEKQDIQNFTLGGGRVIATDQPGWLDAVHRAVTKPAIILHGPPTLRAVVRDQTVHTIVHLYNLDARRLSTFTDEIHPAEQIGITLRVPFNRVRSVRALTADAGSTRGKLDFTAQSDGREGVIELTYPKLETSAILFIEP